MWGPGIFRQQPADSEPATCSSTHDTLASQYVSAAQLCAALNRPDPPTLLETPEDHTRTAGGSRDWITLAGGARTAAPEANVVLQTYSVKLSASYDHLPVTQAADPRVIPGRRERSWGTRRSSTRTGPSPSLSPAAGPLPGPATSPAACWWPGTRRTAAAPSRSSSGAKTTCCPMTRLWCASPRRCCRRSPGDRRLTGLQLVRSGAHHTRNADGVGEAHEKARTSRRRSGHAIAVTPRRRPPGSAARTPAVRRRRTAPSARRRSPAAPGAPSRTP